ncbi:hypothetical protein EKG38_24520 [Shewanella canadensis]|uniref:Uncharacterized protein n=1 Tax=Shewanella canadensis TaxID=271096 RepID=A0A3S0RTH4_9GAMM|nr:hypothetical protein EKG38_24520 [Shewanella canadensis]
MVDDVDIDTDLLRIDQAKGKIDRIVPIALNGLVIG